MWLPSSANLVSLEWTPIVWESLRETCLGIPVQVYSTYVVLPALFPRLVLGWAGLRSVDAQEDPQIFGGPTCAWFSPKDVPAPLPLFSF